ATERHLADQLLEAPPAAVLARLPEVGVDDVHAVGRPPERRRPLGQGILVAPALRVVLDLLGAGLADVDVGAPLQVPGRDLLTARGHHRRPPSGPSATSPAPRPASPGSGPPTPARARRWAPGVGAAAAAAAPGRGAAPAAWAGSGPAASAS